MKVEWLRRYRFLMLVYGLALLAGFCEFRDRRNDRPPDEPAETMARLYPESSDIQYILARGFEKQGAEALRDGRIPESRAAFAEARRRFERALGTGVKTEEKLFYHYALTLVFLDADPDEIAQSVAAWRYNFPDSQRPDPREPAAATAALEEFQSQPGRY